MNSFVRNRARAFRRTGWWWWTAACILTPLASAATGVVVESVEEGSACYRANIRPGDLLLTWSRAPSPPAHPEGASSTLSSPFDVVEAEIEQASRGALEIRGTREGEPFTATVPPGEWRIETRPNLSGGELTSYLRGQGMITEGRLDEGIAHWDEVAASLRGRGESALAVWLSLRIARARSGGLGDPVARDAFDEAFDEATERTSPGIAARILDVLAKAYEARADLDNAAAVFRRALALRRGVSPETLEVAENLNDLGRVAFVSGDLAAAGKYFRGALTLREESAPGSLEVAGSLNNVGLTVFSRGDLAGAEDLFSRALAIYQRLTPDTVHLALIFNNVGALAWKRGNLALAEDHYQAALDIRLRMIPDSLETAVSLNNLSILAWERDDLETAEDYLERALAIQERFAPDSPDLGMTFNNLGNIVSERGDLTLAEKHFRRSLEISNRIGPRSLEAGFNYSNLGQVALDRGDPGAAKALHLQALAIYEDQAPGSLDYSQAHQDLAAVAMATRSWSEAETHLRRATSIREELAPGSLALVYSISDLARVLRRTGRLQPAAEHYRRALDAFESQRQKLGGSDRVKSRFAARFADLYQEYLDLLLELGDAEGAFHVLERFRARELLALLAERDLMFTADVPEDLDRERRIAEADYDRLLAKLAGLSDENPEEQREEIRRQLREVRIRQARIREEIRQASPRLASLQYPAPLDLARVREELDRGTLLLAYSIGKDRSHLFTVGPRKDDFAVVPLDVAEDELHREVRRFRRRLEASRGVAGPGPMLRSSARLTETLLEPVASRIAGAERLLILPDGPLYFLPFAALADPGAPGEGRFLIESLPLVTTASVTVFAELKKQRSQREARIVAFGDPSYPADNDAGGRPTAAMRAILRGGFRLDPLPATRHELEQISALYPESSRLFLGPEATESRAKSVGADPTVLHFACHAIVDESSPLDSSLALSIPDRPTPGRDNGLLQVWEIFEQVRLDADLVTLSACQTGLGELHAGEGIVGLTRAFHYAGSRSVLASLWSVNDASTSELMSRFYRYLKEETKDEALRRAQVDLIRGRRFSHPHHWAAFQLFGDWY